MKQINIVLVGIMTLFLFSALKPEKGYYSELYRPQFHFTPEKNWLSNPSGLVFYKGEYHMFYQYNPTGNESGYAHWGHAISKDLMRWEHQPIALYPDEDSKDSMYCTVLQGSAIVDEHNLLGKQKGEEKTLVLFYTSQNCGQRIAYSTDKGRTWEKYENNPVIPFDESDEASSPKVIWFEPTQKWVMVLNRKSGDNDNTRGISFYVSENLIDWEWKSHIAGFSESSDLVQFKVTNRPEETKWGVFDGDGSYIIGSFNGEEFSPETGKMLSDFGKNYFGAQTWSNVSEEDGRIIQIASLGGEFPEMPFKGQMTFPSELYVTKFNFGYKLIRKPVKEIEQLHGKHYSWENKNLIPGINENILKKVSGDCIHIIAEFDIKTSNNFGFMIREGRGDAGTEVLYNVKRGTLSVLGSTVPLPPIDNKIKLEILVDRSSIEIYANDGQAVVSNCFTPAEKAEDYVLFTNGGELEVINMDVYSVESGWSGEN